uniref:hypothetical protein n=1 Tax=Mesorhizobium sp. 131-2-5 TaxID=2744519 RepID=UPI001FD3A1C2|nr:hypothetical protein [Mesorhizobium sp. 131-2-5]
MPAKLNAFLPSITGLLDDQGQITEGVGRFNGVCKRPLAIHIYENFFPWLAYGSRRLDLFNFSLNRSAAGLSRLQLKVPKSLFSCV